MASTDEDSDTKTADKMEWDADMEIQLFYAMFNHKPVGVSKHFQMLCIAEKLSNSLAKEISIKDIWDHLETMYNLKLLDDTEPPTFPIEEVPFSLPEKEFGELMKQKLKEADGGDDLADIGSPSPTRQLTRHRSSSSNNKGRKDSSAGLLLATKTRKESGSSHASTETPRSEKSSDPRRDSRDSNASGPSSNRKSLQKDRRSKGADEDTPSRRAPRRRTNTPTISPPTTRRRT